MGIWRCSLQNQGGQNSPTKARPDARDVPVKYANKAKRIEAFSNHDKK
jgi:hypothetical protein